MEWYFFAIASAVISGLVPSVNKAILNDSEDALEFSAVLSLVNAILVLPVLFLVSFASIPAKTALLLFLGSAFGTFGFLYISRSMKTLPVSVVSPLTNFNPVVLVVLASLVLGEKLVARQLFGIFLVLLGAYLLERMTHGDGGTRTGGAVRWAFLLALASAVFYGFSSIIDKRVLSIVSPLQYILLAHIFIAFNFAVLSNVWRARTTTKLSGLLGRKKGLFLSSSLLTIAYRLLQANAVSLAQVSLVIPIRHLNSLVSTAIGGKLFSEGRLPEKMAIGAMMVAGTYFIIL